jgi:glycosyltransferase involved in cell wall biosynthesis
LKPIRVAVVTNVLPRYRAAFYERLIGRDELDVRVYCQTGIPGMNLDLVHDRFATHVTVVRSTSLSREWLGWQWLPWRRLLSSFDVLFVQGNPRVISNVFLATLARFVGKPVIIWGQAHTANADARTEGLRLWWWRWFDSLFVYTDGEVRWLRGRGFRRQHIVGMNNGLDQDRIDAAAAAWDDQRLATWRQSQAIAGRTLVLSCARLEPKNRFDTWLAAMPAVISRYPDLLWCAIGDGQERQALERQSRTLGLTEHVRWLGTIVDEADLAPWFRSSQVLVHPAAIGLTLLHAFGYGLPVITHCDAGAQMPEFGAFVEGETGLLYRRGDVANLAEVMCECLADESGRRRMASRAQRIAREEYNVQVMVDRFVDMAKHAVVGR